MSSDASPRAAHSFALLAALVVGGAALRLALLASAENALDADEAVVGLMALDILDGKATPFFFYGTSYNGGGALEAYLGACAFWLLGASSVALKACILGLWVLSAALFAGLCRRVLARGEAIVAVAVFCLGTPFFLEWSLKARGGYIETLLFPILMLWLAAPPSALAKRPTLQCLCFGLATGLALWASEMSVAMLPCAAVWLLVRRPRGERLRAFGVLVAAMGVGLVPLILYNLRNDWAHLTSSVLFQAWTSEGGEALGFDQLAASASFVLGGTWPIAAVAFAVLAVRWLRTRRLPALGWVLLVHAAVYLAAYWLSGLRYLPVPPSRVLFVLQPNLAVLVAIALTVSRGRGRAVPVAVVLAWALVVAVPVSDWIASGVPRETGSWRGSWALTDGDALDRQLTSMGVETVWVGRWTAPPLAFAVRSRLRRDPESRVLAVRTVVPDAPRTARRSNAAIVIHRETALPASIAAILRRSGIEYERSDWRAFAIFSGIDSTRIHRGVGLARRYGVDDWPPLPKQSDGFN